MTRAAKSATAMVVAIHLLINIVHGVAHRELDIGLSPTGLRHLGFILLSLSMSASLLFGLYHHFLVTSHDHVHSPSPSPWGTAFIFTAYGLLVTEVIGTYVGNHFLWDMGKNFNQTPKI